MNYKYTPKYSYFVFKGKEKRKTHLNCFILKLLDLHLYTRWRCMTNTALVFNIL